MPLRGLRSSENVRLISNYAHVDLPWHNTSTNSSIDTLAAFSSFVSLSSNLVNLALSTCTIIWDAIALTIWIFQNSFQISFILLCFLFENQLYYYVRKMNMKKSSLWDLLRWKHFWWMNSAIRWFLSEYDFPWQVHTSTIRPCSSEQTFHLQRVNLRRVVERYGLRTAIVHVFLGVWND